MGFYWKILAFCTCTLAIFTIWPNFGSSPANAQIIENNSTNFHNLLWLRKYNLNRYHTYLFDYWKAIDFDKFFKNLQQQNTLNTSLTEDEILANLQHDNENETMITKVASLCGRLRNASSPFISDDCFKDLDFVACTLFDFIRNLRSLIKGECDHAWSSKDVLACNENLKKKLLDNMWPIYMLDSFGKLPSGLNMGNHMTLGRYTDCNSIIVPRETHKGRSFEANYCRATFRIPLPETAADISRQCHGQSSLINADNMTCKPSKNFARMKWGICAPSTCNTRNMTVLFRYMIFPTKNFCNVTVVCTSPSGMAQDGFFITIMTLFTCILALAISGTIYDLLIYQPAIEDKAEEKYEMVKDDKMQYESNGVGGANNTILNLGETRQEYYKGLPGYYKLMLAFSVYTNGKRLLDTEENPQEFMVVHAIRSLSTIWTVTILSHIYIISYIDNAKVIPRFVSSFWYQAINNGSFVSDTFLMLSGFLLCYWFLRRVHDTKESSSFKFWGRFYLKRFIRFFPTYFALLLFFLFVWKYLINGPMWTIYFFNPCSPLQCKTSVWTNVLFLSNFLKTKTPCLPIMQLLTLDVQLQFAAPPLLICLLKFPKISVIVNSLLIVCSCLVQVVLTLTYDLPPSLMGNGDIYSLDKPLSRYYNIMFIKPYTRWNAFIIGLMLAQAVIKKPNFMISIVKKYAKLIWIVSIGLCCLVIFGLSCYAKNKTITMAELIAYAALSRLCWTISVAFMLYMCLVDRGGIVNWFLSQSFWAPISRLSYAAFLTGPLVVLYGYTTSKSTLHMTSYTLFYFSMGCTVMTLLVSFAFHLLFEAPILTLRRLWSQKDSSEYHIVKTTARNNDYVSRKVTLHSAQIPMDDLDNHHHHQEQKNAHPGLGTLFKRDDGALLDEASNSQNERSTAKLQQQTNDA